MKKTTVKNFTPRNFKKIADYIADKKHYDNCLYGKAENIALQLFDTLAANPGGDIWTYADNIIIAEIDTARRTAAHLLTEIKRAEYKTESDAGAKRLTDAERQTMANYLNAITECKKILLGALNNEII